LAGSFPLGLMCFSHSFFLLPSFLLDNLKSELDPDGSIGHGGFSKSNGLFANIFK
jgi:hypothetical protein